MKQNIKVYGTAWCNDCRIAKSVLEKMDIKFDYIDISEDQKAADFVEKVNNGYRSVPTIIFPDGSKLVEPSIEELLSELN